MTTIFAEENMTVRDWSSSRGPEQYVNKFSQERRSRTRIHAIRLYSALIAGPVAGNIGSLDDSHNAKHDCREAGCNIDGRFERHVSDFMVI